jgi:vesicle coat complex subunit
VRAIGRCAVNLDQAAQRCIAVLLELIQTKVNYVVQEAVIVIKVSEMRCRMSLCCQPLCAQLFVCCAVGLHVCSM